MTVLHRRILYSIAFLIFFVTAPLLIGYCAGYRYDRASHSFFKTGFITANCSAAPDSIRLNGTPQKKLGSNIRVGNLAPGSYTLQIEKTGYAAWENSIIVRAGVATVVGFIQLYRQAAPTVIANTVESFSFSPDQDTVALVRAHDPFLSLIRLPGTSEATVAIEHYVQSVQWSPNGMELLLLTDHGWYVVQTDTPTAVTPVPFLTPPTYVQWSERTDDHLYLVRDDQLFDFSLRTMTETLLAKNVFSFSQNGNELLIQQHQDSATLLGLLQNNRVIPVVVIPSTEHLDRVVFNDEVIVMRQSSSSSFFLLDRTTQPVQVRELPNTSKAVWSERERQLAYGNDVELSLFIPKANATELVTRTSAPVNDFAWFDASLIFSVGDELRAISTSSGANRSPTTLFHADIKKIVPKLKNRSLYLLAQDGSLVEQPL